ncbi:MAG: tripartite tricarboxylate transporter substrate binding protein [Chloroflexota bacterium]
MPRHHPAAGNRDSGLLNPSSDPTDGYTIGNTSIPAAVTITLDEERKSAFKLDGFAHIGLHVFDPAIIAVQPGSTYRTLKDLIEDAKANPGKIKAGTTGILGDDHLAILQLQKMTGAKFAIVHFTGGAPEQTTLMGGHIDVAFNNVGDVAKNHKSGKARIIAIMDKERSKFIPEIPTAEEQGYKLNSASARSVSAPKDTPKEIVWAISRAMEQSMKDPDHVKKMDDQSLTLRYMNPDEFTQYWMEFAEQVKPLMPLAREK